MAEIRFRNKSRLNCIGTTDGNPSRLSFRPALPALHATAAYSGGEKGTSATAPEPHNRQGTMLAR